jgi:hypothetical protein
MRPLVALVLCGLTACSGNNPPRMVSLTNREVAVGQTLEIFVTAVDPDGDRLTYIVRDKPERATFETTPLGGRFLWTPLATDVPPGVASQTYRVTFIVEDGRGGSEGETILITVTRGGTGQGSPVFITPADYVLDLAQSDTLDVTVGVQDDDSPEVSFELLQGPEGAILAPFGPKSVELTWTPTPAQVADRTLYFLRVAASDGVNEPVEQTITVLLRRKPGLTCTGTPPVIVHDRLPDQNRAGPYRVEARVTDAQSAIQAVTLFWTTRSNPGTTDFQSVLMSRDSGSANLFAASIPDLHLAAGASATVSYFLCARDDDDPSGETCDQSACLPEGDQYFTFVASAGSTSCTEDYLEPNNSAPAASPLTSGSDLSSLRLCGGNDDWFRLELGAGDVVDALVSFTHANGDLDLQAYDVNGTAVLATSASSIRGVNEERVHFVTRAAGRYFLRVYGAAGVSNSYDIVAYSRTGPSCTDDAREPNDTSAQAATLATGTYSGLMVCARNDDWYKVSLRAGENLNTTINFTHASGDLDLYVYRPDRATLLAKSDGITDRENVNARAVPDPGSYYILVTGYDGAQNHYDLVIEVTVGP